MSLSNRLKRIFFHYENLICDIYDLTNQELKDKISSENVDECLNLLLVSLVDIGEIKWEDIRERYQLSKIRINNCLESIYDRRDPDIKKKLKYIHANKHVRYTPIFGDKYLKD